ncbi:MAG: peptidylprolyl isomerase [Clostridia bacterium]|nr:peptidylprolyl isomerase [Clostridia bacterium]
MAKEQLNKAEQYRKERKERLSKEAKKNAKRNATVAKIKSLAIKIVAAIVVLAIVSGVAIGVVNATGSTVFRTKVATVGDYNISSVEFQYYYRTVYNYYYNYTTQGYSLGLDATISPDEQKYTADDEAQESDHDHDHEGHTHEETEVNKYDTWNDFFSDQTLIQIKNYVVLAQLAEKEGVSLSEAEEKDIETQIEEMRSTAVEGNYTLNAYLKLMYGAGTTEKLVRKLMLRDALARKYAEVKVDEYADSYKIEEVNKEYNENKNEYNYADYRFQTFNVSDNEGSDATKKRAEEFMAKATSAEAFETAADEILIADAIESANETAENSENAEEVDEAAIRKEYKDNKDNTLKASATFADTNNTNADMAKWIFESSAKVGEVKLFEVKNEDKVSQYIVALLVKAPYRIEDFGVNVRHILFNFNETSTEPTAEEKKAAKEKADAALKEWNAGDKTEDSFAAIAVKQSADTGSASKGGLYENVTKGQMVKNFEDWCLDSSRKTGDTGIVETEYGYHVMYFVSKSERPIWENTARNNLASEKYDKYISEILETEEYEIDEHSYNLKMADKKVIKSIKQYLFNVSQNASANSNYQ